MTSAPHPVAPTSHRLWWPIGLVGSISFLLAPQLPYLTTEAAHPLLAAILTIVAAVGLTVVAGRRLGRPPVPRLVSLAATTLWLPALIPGWRGALGAAAAAVAAAAVVAVAVALWRLRPAGRQGMTLLLGIAALLVVVAEVGRRLVGNDAVSLAWALAWSLVVLAGLVGWGRLVAPAVGVDSAADWGVAGALGMAVVIVMLGLGNLTWTLKPVVLELVVALGVGAWAATTAARSPAEVPGRGTGSRPGLHPVVTGAIAVGLALQLAGAVAGTVDTTFERPAFDRHDDRQAYLVFPDKMLTLGSLGPDPWEARRMLTLGAQSGLQSLILLANPTRTIHLVDAGLGVVLLVGLVLGAARREQLAGWQTALALAVVLTLPHPFVRGNTSAVLTGAVLLLLAFRLAGEAVPRRGRLPGALILGLAGAVALKSTLAPAVAVVGLGTVAIASQGRRQLRRGTGLAVKAAAAGLLCLLPWMVSSLESSHTLLYPVLGHGTYGGVTDDFSWAEGNERAEPTRLATAVARHGAALLPLLVLVAISDRRRRGPTATVAMAAVATVLALAVMGDPRLNRSFERYLFPVTTAATLGLLVTALATDPRRRPGAATAAAAVAVLLVLGRPDGVADLYEQLTFNSATALEDATAAGPQERAAATALSDAIPSGATVLATLENPWLLDPARHRLRLMSLPGMASPPPGLPLDEGPVRLAEVLTGQGVRYLAYGGMRDVTDLLQLTASDIRGRYPESKARWVMLRGHERYRQLVERLADRRKRRYDDGRRIVLDLAVPAWTATPADGPARWRGWSEDGWTGGRLVVTGLEARGETAFVVLRTRGRHPAWTEPGAVEVRLGARTLPEHSRHDGAVTYAVDRPPSSPFALEIASPALPPTELGARPGGPGLGVDLEAVEVVSDPALARVPIATVAQPFAGPLEPERVWQRRGWYADFGWTDGEGVLDQLEWSLPSGCRALRLELAGVHPDTRQPGRLELHLVVDGLDLPLLELAPRRAVFGLPPGLGIVHTVRVRSATFVPAERAGGDDRRTLGVPVERIVPVVGRATGRAPASATGSPAGRQRPAAGQGPAADRS